MPVIIVATIAAFVCTAGGLTYWLASENLKTLIDKIDQKADHVRNSVSERVRRLSIDSGRLKTVAEVAEEVKDLQKLWANKISINIFTFQGLSLSLVRRSSCGCESAPRPLLCTVMHQYGSIVTGYEFDFDYPEPARTFGTYMSAFGFDFLNIAPPEVCWHNSAAKSRSSTKLAGNCCPQVPEPFWRFCREIWEKHVGIRRV